VCGHTQCGGIKAALSNHTYGLIDHWLMTVKELAQKHAEELSKLDDAAKELRLVQLNAEHSMKVMSRLPAVQDAWRAGQSLTLHAWVYDVATAKVEEIAQLSTPAGQMFLNASSRLSHPVVTLPPVLTTSPPCITSTTWVNRWR